MMVMGPEIFAQNKDLIRVHSTRVNGTLSWNLVNTSFSELGGFYSLGSMEMPGLELAWLVCHAWEAVRVSPVKTVLPDQGWGAAPAPDSPGQLQN